MSEKFRVGDRVVAGAVEWNKEVEGHTGTVTAFSTFTNRYVVSIPDVVHEPYSQLPAHDFLFSARELRLAEAPEVTNIKESTVPNQDIRKGDTIRIDYAPLEGKVLHLYPLYPLYPQGEGDVYFEIEQGEDDVAGYSTGEEGIEVTTVSYGIPDLTDGDLVKTSKGAVYLYSETSRRFKYLVKEDGKVIDGASDYTWADLCSLGTSEARPEIVGSILV